MELMIKLIRLFTGPDTMERSMPKEASVPSVRWPSMRRTSRNTSTHMLRKRLSRLIIRPVTMPYLVFSIARSYTSWWMPR